MFAKTMIAAGALAATLTAAAPMEQAAAKTNIDINVGIGSGWGYDGWGYGGGYYGYPRPHHYTPAVSCREGSRTLRYSGYYDIRPVDCTLPTYRYVAFKGYKKYVVTVNRFGDIVYRDRIY